MANVFVMDVAHCINTALADPKDSERIKLIGKANLVVGDQLSLDSLLTVSKKVGKIDLLIDDGGHTMIMQRLTFMVMFPQMSPGGIYFIEDMSTSSTPRKSQDNFQDANGETSVSLVAELIMMLNYVTLPASSGPLMTVIQPFFERVTCTKEVCAIHRNFRPSESAGFIEAHRVMIEKYARHSD